MRMMCFIIALLAIVIFSGCSAALMKKENFNFQNSQELARFQDSLIRGYNSGDTIITHDKLSKLKNNLWVKTAAKLAPGNLVIRQWCLIDIFGGELKHEKKIKKMMNCLSYGKEQDRIWAEGYSYWLYTRYALDIWLKIYQWRESAKEVKAIANDIESGFFRTAYLRGNMWYPAPFGDVRDDPMIPDHQLMCNSMKSQTETATVAIVTLTCTDSSIVYDIKGKPKGMNHHIPKDDYTVKVIDGIPEGFTFYTGLANKYSSKEEEMKDLLDKDRLETIDDCN